ncbi:DNA-directed DNA polymerase II small subunit [Nitrosopumilus sp. b1]|uniref:DNA-directed DNA polymerase II small subunit n=1 Tax=Nitrosopumilus sp. b1 TaxID=2109907 RepID=UPI0015F44861|nr:DNA-directed DNA polymerase II small subunit [Nitrosopumilus sp. b1]
MLNREVSLALNYALNKGFQIHPDALKILEGVQIEDLQHVIKEVVRQKTRQKLFLINQDDLETFLGIKEDATLKSEFRILSDPSSKITSAEGVSGYNMLFASRLAKLKKIISNRPEARLLKSISSVIATKSEDDMYVSGLVTERSSERNVVRVTVEDPTGVLEGIVFDKDLQQVSEVLLIDQYVMLKISASKKGGYIIKDVILPDIPDKASNRSETDTYAVFLSDLHIGSKYFMEKEFEDFVAWLSSPDPIARKTRFVLIGGDLVDGVGIYPNQDKELDFPTIESQLSKTYDLLSKIPKNIHVVIMPGNHDPGRRALPQPAIPKKYNSDFWETQNFHMVGNPSMVSLNGVRVLMFHGQSIDDIVKVTPGLSYDKPVNVMKHLLKARHMSPVYGSQTPIAPESEDMMVIDEVPDVFHVGHVHVIDLDLYRGVLMINSGTWQNQTPFQSSVGITPTPGLAIILNLKTFKVYSKDFSVR